MIFLVSPDSVDSDCYCVDKEVAQAIQDGKVVIPILLRPTDDWETVRGVNIGAHHKGGLPLPTEPERIQSACKDRVLALSAWDNLDLALTQISAHLTEVFRTHLAPDGVATTPLKPRSTPDDQGDVGLKDGAKKPPSAAWEFLPYDCNQSKLVTACTMAFETWQQNDFKHAQMFLLRGHYEDNFKAQAKRVAGRLIQAYVGNGKAFSSVRRLEAFTWPVAIRDDAGPVFGALFSALGITIPHYKLPLLESTRALLAHLSVTDQVIPLYTQFEKGASKTTHAQLRTFLGELERHEPSNPNWGKLLIVASEALDHERAFWQPDVSVANVTITAPPMLDAIELSDVEAWCGRNPDVERTLEQLQKTREDIITAFHEAHAKHLVHRPPSWWQRLINPLPSAPRLRAGHFADAVSPLLQAPVERYQTRRRA